MHGGPGGHHPTGVRATSPSPLTAPHADKGCFPAPQARTAGLRSARRVP
ncbi:hypothetical protein A176_007515 [Myxococcus hansupus]|uniref:Uncharacterized protein n=1 Tax=Pseudomyxococcus hansupus TaxID=1297742 RepID=A0A0H4X9D1_9BACT|nr:hypothetical protein A176_007515 [Myxococcus hansupus]